MIPHLFEASASVMQAVTLTVGITNYDLWLEGFELCSLSRRVEVLYGHTEKGGS